MRASSGGGHGQRWPIYHLSLNSSGCSPASCPHPSSSVSATVPGRLVVMCDLLRSLGAQEAEKNIGEGSKDNTRQGKGFEVVRATEYAQHINTKPVVRRGVLRT